MKFLVITYGKNVSMFSVDDVRSHHIAFNEKVQRTPAHYVVRVEMKPVKRLDHQEYGVVVEECSEYEWRFDTIEMARAAVRIDEV